MEIRGRLRQAAQGGRAKRTKQALFLEPDGHPREAPRLLPRSHVPERAALAHADIVEVMVGKEGTGVAARAAGAAMKQLITPRQLHGGLGGLRQPAAEGLGGGAVEHALE